jgi:GNAT superfamily N-acetyltransferase
MRITESAAQATANFAARLALGHEHEIGFLPNTIYAPAALEGKLDICHGNGEPTGFLLRGSFRPCTRIYQTLVDPDWRLNDAARSMVLRLIAKCAEKDTERLMLHCACDLPANQFWQNLGFKMTGIREAAGPNCRPAYCWSWQFPAGAAIDEYVQSQLGNANDRKLIDWFDLAGKLTRCHERRFRRARQNR